MNAIEDKNGSSKGQATTRAEIRLDDLRDPRVARFLEHHVQDMRAVSPPESKHALDLEGLRSPQIRFWSAWKDGEIVGCVALKMLDLEHGELKSMRTAQNLRRQGLGRLLLLHAIGQARDGGMTRLSLETGSMAFFAPARALYAAHGFVLCGPFGQYQQDPNSVFMTRELTEDPAIGNEANVCADDLAEAGHGRSTTQPEEQ